MAPLCKNKLVIFLFYSSFFFFVDYFVLNFQFVALKLYQEKAVT